MKAYELLSQPDAWTQGVWARDADGNSCKCQSEKAKSWCTIGAIIACYGTDAVQLRELTHYLKNRYNLSITAWNDNPRRTVTEVTTILKELDI